MSQANFNLHYDATARRGLCWHCKRRRVSVVRWGRERVTSLWCLRCKLKLFGERPKIRMRDGHEYREA